VDNLWITQKNGFVEPLSYPQVKKEKNLDKTIFFVMLRSSITKKFFRQIMEVLLGLPLFLFSERMNAFFNCSRASLIIFLPSDPSNGLGATFS
jgi:hypothetical protein